MSALPWFRMYHRIIDDPKIKLLAFEDRWHFVALCCLTANGTLAVADEDLRSRMVAVALGVQLRELDEIRRRLVVVNLIGPDMVPVAWDELQFQSDNSTARVQKFREKQRCNKAKRYRNVSVTAQDTDTDTDTDQETEKREPNGSCQLAADQPEKLSFGLIVKQWNILAEAKGLPKVEKQTEQRKRAFRVRAREYPDLDDWKRAILNIRDNEWLCGDNDRGWRADFDFLLQAKSFPRLVEGTYGKR